jgi:hypothetical protein
VLGYTDRLVMYPHHDRVRLPLQEARYTIRRPKDNDTCDRHLTQMSKKCVLGYTDRLVMYPWVHQPTSHVPAMRRSVGHFLRRSGQTTQRQAMDSSCVLLVSWWHDGNRPSAVLTAVGFVQAPLDHQRIPITLQRAALLPVE